jgi:uncharacterized membrane protein
MQYLSQTDRNYRPLAVWLAMSALSLATIGLILAAPIALNNGHPFAAQVIYHSFSFLCHQIPARSFFIGHNPFAVCSRCTGIYAGFAIAVLSYPLVRSLRQTTTPDRKWLFVAAAPLFFDFTLGFLGIWNNTHFSRFSTGALLGAVAVFYIMPGLIELALRDWRGTQSPEPIVLVSSNELATSAAAAAPSDYSAPHRRI